jgi:hypothetical protein
MKAKAEVDYAIAKEKCDALATPRPVACQRPS